MLIMTQVIHFTQEELDNIKNGINVELLIDETAKLKRGDKLIFCLDIDKNKIR
jgi:ASC-1-like (ASCH) protein